MQSKEPEINFFDALQRIAQTPYKMMAGIFRLALLEMQLAKKSLLAIVCLFFLLAMVSVTVWLGINIFFAIYLLSFGFLLTNILLILIAFNILLGVIFIVFLAKLGQLVTFSATRQQIISLRKNDKTL